MTRRAAAVLAAALLAGCAGRATGPVPPASGPVKPPLPPAFEAPPPADETFRGVRFGASRAEVLKAYPDAACGPRDCSGAARLQGQPANFLVFAQPDGRWVARLTLSDAAAPGRHFRALNDELGARFARLSETIEQDGNLYRWRDKERQRQVVLRRCPDGARCAGLAPHAVELDFFEQGPPLARPW